MSNVKNLVAKYKKFIYDAESYIWKNPETGYKEYKTSKYMEDAFRSLGYELTFAGDIPGFYTVIDTGKSGPEVLILGELDSIICPAHKESDPVTGAVHSCGHNAQCAALLGIAGVLTEKEYLKNLSGKIMLCAVPAEELLEIEFRSELKRKGVIKYYGGKSEFLSRGYFDDVDLAFMIHMGTDYLVQKGSNGCLAKSVIYKGVASHAGGSPHKGRNALYAATCGLNAVNAIRETFQDCNQTRVHPIITHGGDMVNAIPEEIRLESYVRGNNYPALKEENAKINRALIGAALSVGTNIEIVDMPGYAPLENAPDIIDVYLQATKNLGYNGEFINVYSGGSTDMGDLSMIMPVVHPYVPGEMGKPHGNDYKIVDVDKACVSSAEIQLEMLQILLKDGAEKAKDAIKNFKPFFSSKQEFLDYQDKLNCSGNRIEYTENGAVVKL